MCDPSKDDVDNLAAKPAKAGLKVVRIVARSHEHVSRLVKHLSLAPCGGRKIIWGTGKHVALEQEE